MCAAGRYLRGVAMMAAGALILGCNHEPPVTAPPPVKVVISQPVSRKITDWDVFTGVVEAKDMVDIRARVRGQIKEVRFTEGSEIEEKALLYVIDDDPFQADLEQAKGQLVTWNAKLKAAEEKIAIYEPLAKKGTVSKDELVQAFAAKGEAIGGIDTARGKMMEAEVNIKYCKIHAPIAGKIGQSLLSKGNIINSGGADNVLTTVVAVDPLYVYFYVNEPAVQNYQRLMEKRFEKDKKKDQSKIPVEMALAADSGFPHKGVVDFIDNKVDKSTGTQKVRARFDNPAGPSGIRRLTPGSFARVRVIISDGYPALLIADRAILSDQSRKYVLVVNKAKDNVVERVDVVPATRLQDDGLRAIEAGLKGDEWIIVDGVNRTRPGATVAPKDPVPMPQLPALEK